MKRILLFLMAAAVIVPAFAQRQNAFTINPGAIIIGATAEGFGAGIAYENAFLPQFSVKANAYFLGYEPGHYYRQTQSRVEGFTSTIMFATEGRWYPAKHFLEGVFINSGFQYHLLAGTVAFSHQDETKQFSGIYHTFGFFTGLGYKVIFGKSRLGLVLEPTIDYIWPLYCGIPDRDLALDHNTLAMSAMGIKGFRIGLQIGLAF